MNPKSILTLILFYFLSQECFSQSKKIQIASLNFQLDSLYNEIELRNGKIKSNNTLISELQYRLRFTEEKLSESQNLVMNLEVKSDSLKISNQEISQLKIELNTTKEKYDALLISLAECNDKFASINFIENPSIQIDTVELEKLARGLITEPCPDDKMLIENSCSTEFPCKQFFKLGRNTYFITMVNFSFNGPGSVNGNSIVLLFQIVDSKLKLLDSLSLEGGRYGQGLYYSNDKYLLGKQSFALHLVGGSGGAGVMVGIDYFIAFLNNKLFLVHNEIGSGIYSMEGIEFESEYSFIPSNKDIFDMKISYKENKTIKGKIKKTIKNTIYTFSQQENKYIEMEK